MLQEAEDLKDPAKRARTLETKAKGQEHAFRDDLAVCNRYRAAQLYEACGAWHLAAYNYSKSGKNIITSGKDKELTLEQLNVVTLCYRKAAENYSRASANKEEAYARAFWAVSSKQLGDIDEARSQASESRRLFQLAKTEPKPDRIKALFAEMLGETEGRSRDSA